MTQNLPEQVRKQMENALFAGDKVAAVKIHHESVGLGLAKAKTAIDELDHELRQHSPEKFASSVQIPKQMGGLSLLGVVALLGIVILWTLASFSHDDKVSAARYQHALMVAALVVLAVNTCILSLHPTRRVGAWLAFGATVFLAVALMLR